MRKSTLPEKVYSLSSFQEQYRKVVALSVSESIPGLISTSRVEDQSVDWWNLLACASVLAQSDKAECIDAALRISQHCLQAKHTTDGYLFAATAILEMLTNKPAIRLAIQRNLINEEYRERFPIPLLLHCIGKDIEYSIETTGGSIIPINRFQKSVYSTIVEESKRFVSISAPPSAGKSFILYHVILKLLTSSPEPVNLVYIVPTRALISQVEADLKQVLGTNGSASVRINTIPQQEDALARGHHNIFVFTQERLQWFRMENPRYPISHLIVDEAHKIQDGSRGILLQQEIEELLDSKKNLRVFFSSPFTKNPEYLLNGQYGKNSSQVVKLDFVTVNQNLLFVQPAPTDSKRWLVTLCHDQGKSEIGAIEYSDRPNSETKKVLFIAETFSSDQGGVIIYANGPADAENYALTLCAMRQGMNYKPSNAVLELIELCRKVVHRKYSLVVALSHGVAFHYGNMPQIIRAEIERLFKKGDIQFIICTSTLLEGVNLPARTLVIRKPTKGPRIPMNSSDFWNLAGRAGRWGMEFQGNIVCVEPQLWETMPSPQDKGVRIKRAIEFTKEEEDQFFDFVESGTPRATAIRYPKLEGAFSYYYTAFIRSRLDKVTQNNPQFGRQLRTKLVSLKSTVHIPDEIVIRNPGISPLAMHVLKEYFVSYTDGYENLVPMLPEIGDSAKLSYIPLIRRISRILSGEPEVLAVPRAILVVDWMKGQPLSVLISKSEQYWRNRQPTRKTARIIRDVMSEVEEYARFRFAKYSSCYIDVLRHTLSSLKRNDLIETIPSLHMWLELGVSQQTQISFMSLGLSRNTAIALSEFIRSDKMTSEECIAWLRQAKLSELQISPIMQEEIKRMMPSQ